MTEPDQNLSIPQLLEKHSRGLPVINQRYQEGIYSDSEIPVFDDLNDLMEYKEALRAREMELRGEVEDHVAKKQQKPSEAPSEAKAAAAASAEQSEAPEEVPPKEA